MEKFIIQGGASLSGEIIPSGNKNAALPLIAATLLTDEAVTLHNMPNIRDVQDMCILLESLGVRVQEIGPHTLQIQAANIQAANLDPDKCRRIRASILLAGPMLAREGQLRLPPPGGDVIGRRRVDTHTLALQTLGAEISYDRTEQVFDFKSHGLVGANILLDEASVTATENAIMASVTANGATILRNAASEPHVQELCQFLNTLGAQIDQIGSNTLHIQGVPKLHGGEFTIGPDYLEVVSFIGAAVVTKGSVRIRDAGAEYLDMIRMVFGRTRCPMGGRW